MDIDPAQLVLQLGLAGALIFFGAKVALVLIANWREAEKERTAALAAGFAALVGKVDAHHTADIQSHGALAVGIAEVRSKLDDLSDRDRTPVAGVPVAAGAGRNR